MILRNNLIKFAILGLFLEFGIGQHLHDWIGPKYKGQWSVGSANPLGIVRGGYAWQVDNRLSVNAYAEHISSIPDQNDTGLEFGAVTVRIDF